MTTTPSSGQSHSTAARTAGERGDTGSRWAPAGGGAATIKAASAAASNSERMGSR
jgi:hypothetical protein